jgi:hypothetical protein
MGGGGSSSGTIDYPGYMKSAHEEQLNRVQAWVKSAQDGGPPTLYAYDPLTFYGGASNTPYGHLDDFSTVDIEALFQAAMAVTLATASDDAAITALRAKATTLWNEIGDLTGSLETVDRLVGAHAERLRDTLVDNIARYEESMSNAMAVMGSSFVIGKAIMFDGFGKDVSEYSANVGLKILELRHQLLDTLYKLEPSFMGQKLQSADFSLRRVALYLDQHKTILTASMGMTDAVWDRAAKYGLLLTEDDVRRKEWALEQFEYFDKTLASIAGASPVKTATSINAGASVLAGAAAGAAAGTAVSPGYGTAIGAVVGGLAGYMASR